MITQLYILLYFTNPVGLGDPWSSSNPAEPPPPSYDMVATGTTATSTLDPWGAPSGGPASTGAGVGDPWGPTASMPTPAPNNASLGVQSSGGATE